jgi:hypothetical protein
MGEIHVHGVAPFIVIKVVKGRIFNGCGYLVDDNGKALFIEKGRVMIWFHDIYPPGIDMP